MIYSSTLNNRRVRGANPLHSWKSTLCSPGSRVPEFLPYSWFLCIHRLDQVWIVRYSSVYYWRKSSIQVDSCISRPCCSRDNYIEILFCYAILKLQRYKSKRKIYAFQKNLHAHMLRNFTVWWTLSISLTHCGTFPWNSYFNIRHPCHTFSDHLIGIFFILAPWNNFICPANSHSSI